MAVSSWLRYIDMQGNKLSGGFFLGAKNKEEFMSLVKKEKLIFLPIQTIFNREIAFKLPCMGMIAEISLSAKEPRHRRFLQRTHSRYCRK